MTPANIIRNALTDGVKISLSTAGKIKAVGNEIAVNRWLPLIRGNYSGPAFRSAGAQANRG